MVSVMQYRAVVGLFNNFVKAKEMSDHVKGRFWSMLLLLFYVVGIYFPTLQRQAHLQFSEIWMYHFYFALLVRLANDVETNPGPVFLTQSEKTGRHGDKFVERNETGHLSSSMSLLRIRLCQRGLRPLDVGSGGDCFFRAVSHQIFGTADYHLDVRAAGMEHLRQHPEHFIESNIDQSWLQYLSTMCRQGTWCDNIIIQAVSNALNCIIHIIESAENFAESNVIVPVGVEGSLRTIYIGHLDEIHYVSTIHAVCEQSSIQYKECFSSDEIPTERYTEGKSDSDLCKGATSGTNNRSEKRKTYMREYMKKRRMDIQFRKKENKSMEQKRNENLTKMREYTKKRRTSSEYRANENWKRQEKRKESVKKLIRCKIQCCKEKSDHDLCKGATFGTNNHSEKQKAYMREYMKKRRADSWFRKKENKRKDKKKIIITYKRQCSEDKMESHPSELRKEENKNKERNENLTKMREYTKKRRTSSEYRGNENWKRQEKRKESVEKLVKCKRHCFEKERQSHPNEINVNNREEFFSEESLDLEKNSKMEGMSDATECNLISSFHNKIKCGPEYVCTCCDQLWFRSSVKKCNALAYSKSHADIVNLCLTGYKSIDNQEWICFTCDNNIKNGKLPSFAKANKMNFAEKPEILYLTELEERLISPRIPFMQIRELPSGGQLSIHGNVVNVPADVNSTVNFLPRSLKESETIPIKLKRRLNFKHHYQFQTIRPRRVIEAAKYLVQNSELFKNEGVKVGDGWLNSLNNSGECLEFIDQGEMKNVRKIDSYRDCNASNVNEVGKSVSANDVTCSDENVENGNDSDDEWCEETEYPSGVMDTLLQEPDMTEHGDNIISFAPGEGNRPLGIFIDRDSEFLSFPSIYCGKRRADNKERLVPVQYSTICKWELRSQDRRVAQSVANIFYKLKKLQIKQIQGSASVSLRKCKGKGKKFTAGDLKSDDSLNKLIHLDEGYRVFRNLRGSPPYFERCKKDLFAMIRQLGKPTWFCSFSAAETRWTHLLKILGRVVDKKNYSDSTIQNMTWQEKSELIKSDPVTCARNFEHMVQLFFRDFLKSPLKPIGEIVDFFYRVEFQKRGSPHIHCLFWIKNAPQYGKDSNEDICKFVDKYVSCEADVSELGDLVNLQRHRHSKTCKKNGHKICRFNFPLFPMGRTMILEPLSETVMTEIGSSLEKQYGKIQQLLGNLKRDEEINFVQLLKQLGLTEEEYILAIRFSLKRDTLLLKRAPCEARINCFNFNLLKAWQANMDIQYILDPYACAVYILSYITKGQRGMSKLLQNACEEVSSGNKDIKSKIRHIGNKFLNAVEISSQEAVYLVLQMPLRKSSREFQFINTSNPEERAFLLKPIEKLKELPDSSDDIECDNVIKRYQRRPKQLEKLCLADFVAWYDCKNYSNHAIFDSKVKKSSNSDDCLPENQFDDNIDDDVLCDGENEVSPKVFQLKGGLTLVKRRKAKIIRSVRFNKDKDPGNYFREQLMLYFPWRSEKRDLILNCESYKEKFEQVKNIVAHNREQYECHEDILDKAVIDNVELEEFGNVAPNIQYKEELDQAIGTKPSSMFRCFDPGTNKQHNYYDLMIDTGIFPRTSDNEELVVKRLSDKQFRVLVRSLNMKQMEFFYHVLHFVKTEEEQLTLFLSGGAGVGKSRLTNALYEALVRYLDSVPGENPDEIKVLKAAPTGKAAYLIGGNTLHAIFNIPINRGFQYIPLHPDVLNTKRSELRKLKTIFIDEISMVGSGMFMFLNLRLQQIMGTQKLFGGVNVIAVGDLFQLKPVFDQWIFENSKRGYHALATNIWQENFLIYELTKIMRQKDNIEFAELLNRLREGRQTVQDIQILKGTILDVKATESSYPMHLPHLFCSNKAVNKHNLEIFNNSKNEKVCVNAIDVIVADLPDEVKERMKEKIPKEATKTMGLYFVCPVVVGGRYDLTTNVCVVDGMTNGAECIVEKIDYRVPDSSRPSIIWVSFQEPTVGCKQRKEFSHLYSEQIEKNWTPVLEITRQFQLFQKKQVQVFRRQFPLRPASAKTIHRCQGDTMNEAVVDLPCSKKDHMHYVALSRLRNISGLHVLKLYEDKISTSEKVQEEMCRLRSKKLLKPCVAFLYKTSNKNRSDLKVLFQNVRSLHLHIKDVASDYSVQAADINIFVESGLIANDRDDSYELNNFKLFRNDYNPPSDIRTPYGTAVYIQNDVVCLCQWPFRYNYCNIEMTVIVVHSPIENMHIIGIYRSKSKVRIAKLIEGLQHLHDTIVTDPQIPVIILGDFNVDFMGSSSEKKALVQYLIDVKGYKQLINKFTTDYKSQIDHIYTNIPDQIHSCGTLESYYSDHKPIFVCIKSVTSDDV